MQEFLSYREDQMRGSLDLMSLEPLPGALPSASERLAYYLVHNGNDALRQWNWNFALRFVSDAEKNSQEFVQTIVNMTIISVCVTFFVSVAFAIAVGKAEEKKLHALSFFTKVPNEEIERLIRTCDIFS